MISFLILLLLWGSTSIGLHAAEAHLPTEEERATALAHQIITHHSESSITAEHTPSFVCDALIQLCIKMRTATAEADQTIRKIHSLSSGSPRRGSLMATLLHTILPRLKPECKNFKCARIVSQVPLASLIGFNPQADLAAAFGDRSTFDHIPSYTSQTDYRFSFFYKEEPVCFLISEETFITHKTIASNIMAVQQYKEGSCEPLRMNNPLGVNVMAILAYDDTISQEIFVNTPITTETLQPMLHN